MLFVSELFRAFIGFCFAGSFFSICLYAVFTGHFPEVSFKNHKVFEEVRQPLPVLNEVPEEIPAKNPENTPEEPKSVDALVGILGNMQKLMTGSDKLER